MATKHKKPAKQQTLPISLQFSETNTFLPAFRYKNLEFFGGQKWDVGAEILFDLIINLTGSKFIFTLPTIDNPTIFANLVKEIEIVRATPQLVIKWEDYGVPDIPPNMWHGLVEDLRNFADSKPDEILTIGIFCDGGTGRTGTALAILRTLLLKDRDSDPVKAIRTCYKQDAVETLRQVLYVEGITGLDSTCTGSKPVTYTSTTYKPTTALTTTPTTTAGTSATKTTAFTCTHTLAIPGCKGGCVEFYAKVNKPQEDADSKASSDYIKSPNCDGCKYGITSYPHDSECRAVNKAYATNAAYEEGEEDLDDFDCPACKLGGNGIAHTVECNKRYFEKSGLCGECFEDVKESGHNPECSEFGAEPIVVSEEEASKDNWVDALIDRMTNRTAEQIEACEGCVAGESDASYHTKECNDNYFKTSSDAPF